MTRAFGAAGLGILLSAAAIAQASAAAQDPTLATAARFEVASIRQAVDQPSAGDGVNQRGVGGGCTTSMKLDRARIDFKCVTTAMLIGYAFRVSPERVRGPAWMMAVGPPRFDVAARIPEGSPETLVPEMLQALLAERFRLIIHRETAKLPVYGLVLAKGGLKLKKAPGSDAWIPSADTDADATRSLDAFFGNTQSRTIANDDGGEWVTFSNPRMGTVRQTGDPHQVLRWDAPAISLAGLADLLDKVAPLSTPVVDMTGLRGRYQLVLEVSLKELFGAAAADPATGDMEETVLNGFNRGLLKLGLRLELRKRPLEILVVDHVEKTPAAN